MGIFPQVGGNEDASLLIRFHFHRTGKEEPLQGPGTAHGQSLDLGLQFRPLTERIDKQTVVQALGDNELVPEIFPQARRKVKAALEIYTGIVFPDQHRLHPLFGEENTTSPHFYPLT